MNVNIYKCIEYKRAYVKFVSKNQIQLYFRATHSWTLKHSFYNDADSFVANPVSFSESLSIASVLLSLYFMQISVQ